MTEIIFEKNKNLEETKNLHKKIEKFEKRFKLLKNSNLILDEQKEKIEYFFRKRYEIKKNLELLDKDLIALNIAIVGEFSSGKSSIINSILGERIIPTGDEPMTSVVSVFKYGDEKYIEAEIDGRKKILTEDEFLLIKHGTEKEANEKLKIDVDKIEKLVFYYPNPLLNKIHIIDTPGFATANKEGDDEKTMRTIEKDADILFWTIDINQGTINETSLKRIQNIRKDKPNLPIFIIVNKVDSKGKPSSEKVVNILNEIKRISKVEEVYPYSAIQVLRAQNKENYLETTVHKIKEIISNGYFPILIDKKTQKRIKSVKENIEIIFSNNGSETQENILIENFSEWLNLKENLVKRLDEIREKSKNYVHFSLLSEIDELINFSENLLENIDNKLNQDLSKIKKFENLLKRDFETNSKLLEKKLINIEKKIENSLFRKIIEQTELDWNQLSEDIWKKNIEPDIKKILDNIDDSIDILKRHLDYKKEINFLKSFIKEEKTNFQSELKESYNLFINLVSKFIDKGRDKGLFLKNKKEVDDIINEEHFLRKYLKNLLEKYLRIKYSLILNWLQKKKEEIENIKR